MLQLLLFNLTPLYKKTYDIDGNCLNSVAAFNVASYPKLIRVARFCS